MESLTGKSTRKRASSGDNSEPSADKVSKFNAPVQKEIIPSIFRKSVSLNKRKVSSEQLSKPEDLEMLKSVPCDTEAALLSLRSSFPVELFGGRLPPVFLYSQLSSLVHSRAVIDHQLKKLADDNKILTFSMYSSSNYLIVFYSDLVALKRDAMFQRFVNDVLGEGDKSESTKHSSGSSSAGSGKSEKMEYINAVPIIRRSAENSKLILKEALLKKWKFEKDQVRKLVNAGYLGVHEGSYYCISLPAAGEFIKTYEKGKKAVVNSIKRAKFGEILQKELELRPMKKVAPLGVAYHVHDLLGTGDVIQIETTSGPLLRIKRELPM